MYKRKSNFPKVKLDGRNDLWRFGDGGIAVDKRERGSGRRSRWGAWLLAAALMCALWSGAALAAPAEGASLIAESAAPKPQITIQGNVVVDKGKPTGFYELALCVRTARTVTEKGTDKVVDEEVYATELAAALASGKPEDRAALDEKYDVRNYPFQTASAAMTVNLDALTAVTWGAGTPVYEAWTATGTSTSGTYADHDDDYPRGINTKADGQPDIFTDLSPVENATGGQKVRVRLDTAKPDEVNNATAFIEEMEFDAADPTRRTGLLTLTANTTTTRKVVYEIPTPVVVIRFAYDKNRFKNLEVGNPDDLVSEPNTSDFWLGLDRNHPLDGPNVSGKTPLTYLGAQAGGAHLYADSDAQVAGSSVFQSVLYTQNLADDGVTQEPTRFYYYLGAETPSYEGTKREYLVHDEATDTDSEETLYVPTTLGTAILANRDDVHPTAGDPETGAYSFFQNLLTIKENTLRLILVNAETYRKPTGGGGITILFYDWDDSLIGSLIVDGGDVRSQVEEYIEENLVHPDLVPGKVLDRMGGKLPENWAAMAGDVDAQLYQNLTNSLERDYTYRGKYAYTVGDPDDVGADGDTANKARANGEDYPLTNKLDYVFTKRVNTSASYSVTDTVGSHTETYVLPHKLTDNDMVDAALYPYTYGWAVVEDTSDKNQNNWKVMYDAVKLEDTWTTIGVGELNSVDPDYYDNGATDQTLPTTLGTAAYQAPAFLADEDPYWVDPVHEAPKPNMNYTKKYAYSLNSNGSESYFRFADFSDIDAELERYTKKNGDTKDTLMVKAVYEPGESLMDGNNYRVVKEPVYSKYNTKTASTGGAFRVQLTLERSYVQNNAVRGTTRTRFPELQLDTTTDYKWLTSDDPEVNHDLENATLQTSIDKTETTYIKVDVDNGEEVTFNLSLSARMNKIDYVLVESHKANFVGGTQRSDNNNKQTGSFFVPDNYNYLAEDSITPPGDNYYDCDYETREGSYGFVLYGTIGHMLENATQLREGVISNMIFEDAVSYLTARDANLRVNPDKTIGATLAEGNTLRQGIIDAELLCYQNRGTEQAPGPYDCWNWEFDCAKLTYHQLQIYLIERRFLDKATADAQKLDWCHLHSDCAEAMSNKPKTWADVMEAAAQRDADRLKQLSFDELRDLTHLRNNANGGDFVSRDVMINRLINAVNGDASLTDWVDVQNALLGGSGSVDTYFWYDGSTSNAAPGSWNAMLERVTPAITPVTYPDGADRTTKAKLESLRTLFEANAAAGNNRATRQWINVTDNLILAHREEQVEVEVNGETMKEWHYTYSPITDFEAFKTSLVETVTAAQTGGFGDPSWEAVQYHLLFPGEALDFINEPWTNVKLLNTEGWDPDADPPPKQWPEGFWWKGGNIPLTVDNVYTLLQAMEYLNGDDEDDQKRAEEALKAIDLARLEGQNFWLRKNKTGETWLERDETGAVTGPDAATQATLLADLLKDIQAAQAAGAYNWNTLQYYLIHKDDPGVDPATLLADRTKINGETYYYWWRNGGTGTKIDFTAVKTVEDIFPPLFDASIRASEFGDPAAADSVGEQLVDGSFYQLTHLTQTWAGTEETLDQMNWFNTTEGLLQKMNELMKFFQNQQGLTDPYATPTADWHQAQHWLLTGKYIIYGTPDYDQTVKDYWWYDQDKKPEEKPPVPDPTLAVLVWADKYATGGATAVNVTADEWTAMHILAPVATTGKKSTKLTTLAQGKGIMKKLVNAAKKDPTYFDGSHVNVTWAQIQYYVVTSLSGTKQGELVDDATAWIKLKDRGWTAADVPEGVVIPDGVF